MLEDIDREYQRMNMFNEIKEKRIAVLEDRINDLKCINNSLLN